MRYLPIVMVLVVLGIVGTHVIDHPNKAMLTYGGILFEALLAGMYVGSITQGIPRGAMIIIDGVQHSFPVLPEHDGILVSQDPKIHFKAGTPDIQIGYLEVPSEWSDNPQMVNGTLVLGGEKIKVTGTRFIKGEGCHYHGQFSSQNWRGSLSFYTQFNGWDKPTLRIQ